MADFLSWYRGGGWGMHLILLMNLCAVAAVPWVLVCAVGSRMTGKMGGAARVVAILGTVIAGAPGCAGVLGYNSAMWRVESVVARVDPAKRSEIMELGGPEASANLDFGVGSAVCLLLPALLALFIAPRKPPPPAPEY